MRMWLLMIAMKKVSLKDIAIRAGVSPTTVSFVLNGKAKDKRISQDVIDRVEALVKKLDYRPNRMARGLRTGETRTIGLMVEDISNQFFATLAKVIEDEAVAYGYEVIYCSTEGNDLRAEKLLRMLKYRQVDGYILTPTTELETEVRNLIQEDKPFVLMDRYFPGLDTAYVVVDNFRGAYMAVTHLVHQQYRKIAIVTTSSSQLQMQERLRGFRAALKAEGIHHRKTLELSIPFEAAENSAMSRIEDFLVQTQPDAVFFSTNYLGVYGLEMIRKLGWHMPERIGMVCFDDHAIFRLYEPAITCISQPMDKIGECVIKVLMDEIKSENALQHAQYVLEPALVIRKSCREQGDR